MITRHFPPNSVLLCALLLLSPGSRVWGEEGEPSKPRSTAQSKKAQAKNPAKNPVKTGSRVQADPQINALLEPIRKKHGVPALAAAIVSDRGLVVIGAVGVRKHGEDAEVTVEDKFHLGSDTKAMTATVIACLVQSGKFKWDTPLAKLFPEQAASMSPGIAQANLVHVLSHHTSIPDLGPQTWWELQRSEGDIAQKRREAARRVLAAKPTSRPGTAFGYANANYVLAASVAESATGKTWEELIQTTVFDPLDMKTAGFGPMASAGRTDQPWSHSAAGEPIDPERSDNPPILSPAGRVHCSLPDWSKFIADQLRAAVSGESLVNPPMNRLLFRAPFEKKHGYATAGWLTADTTYGKAVAHAGSNTNNYATAWLYPEKARAILVVSNQGGPDGPGQKACDEATQALQIQIFGR